MKEDLKDFRKSKQGFWARQDRAGQSRAGQGRKGKGRVFKNSGNAQ